MKYLTLLPIAALALAAACSDTTNPVLPDSDLLAGKQGAAKQGTNANITFAQMQQNTDWTTSRLGTNNAAFVVGDKVKMRWVREAVPNKSQTMTIIWDAGYGPLESYFDGAAPLNVNFNSSTDLCNGGAGTSLFCEQGDVMPTQMAGPVAVWGAVPASVSADCTTTYRTCVVTFTPDLVEYRSWNHGDGTVLTTSVIMAWRSPLAAAAVSEGAMMSSSVPDGKTTNLDVAARAVSN